MKMQTEPWVWGSLLSHYLSFPFPSSVWYIPSHLVIPLYFPFSLFFLLHIITWWFLCARLWEWGRGWIKYNTNTPQNNHKKPVFLTPWPNNCNWKHFWKMVAFAARLGWLWTEEVNLETPVGLSCWDAQLRTEKASNITIFSLKKRLHDK